MKRLAYWLPPFALFAALGTLVPVERADAQNRPTSTEAPLTGRAWQLANQAYAHYNAQRYAQAEAAVLQSIKLRSDVARLHLLLVYIYQKQDRVDEALKVLASARAARLQHADFDQAEKNLRSTVAGASAAQASPAYAQAFPLATQAYEQYYQKNYVESAALAEQAFRLVPKETGWAQLWIAALEAQPQLDAALQAAEVALELNRHPDLAAKRQVLRRQQATAPAIRAYQAMMAGQISQAIPDAQAAVRLDPETASHRRLLITLLMVSDELEAAEQAATEALEQDDEDTIALGLRGYIRQRQGKSALANADFDSVVAQDWLTDTQISNLRLIAVDAALAGGDAQRANALLDHMESDSEAVAQRRQAARRVKAPALLSDSAQVLSAVDYPAPLQDCYDTPYGTVCDLLPANTESLQTPAARAYAAYGKGNYQEAIRWAQQALQEQGDNPSLQRLLTTTLAAGNAAQQEQALQRLNAALATADAQSETQLLLQRGYLYSNLGQPKQALADFRNVKSRGDAPPEILINEGYALAGIGDSAGAVQTFKQAIDADDSGQSKLTPEMRQNARSAIAGFSRQWGITASASYRGARGLGRAYPEGMVQESEDAIFGTLEGYWRPPVALNTSTRILEAYARIGATLHDRGSKVPSQRIIDPCTFQSIDVPASSASGRAGWTTSSGAVGLRLTPSTRKAVTLGVERQFLLGRGTRSGFLSPQSQPLRCQMNSGDPLTAQYKASAGQGGWLAYITHGFYEGTARRTDQSSWWTVEGYSQLGYTRHRLASRLNINAAADNGLRSQGTGRYQRTQWFASSEARLGRSFNADHLQQGLVIFPFVVVAADWMQQDSHIEVRSGAIARDAASQPWSVKPGDKVALQGNGSSWSASTGPGVSFRQWFRETHYSAAQSYVDWSLQYRASLGNGQSQRAKGLFMAVTLSY